MPRVKTSNFLRECKADPTIKHAGCGVMMGIKTNKPTSPGRRFQTSSTFEEITRKKPEKSLLQPLKRQGVGIRLAV